ncbi:hypothetical protein ACIPN8_36405 [Streptomyces sp. NPDC086082]|uniref:hypothetical protein n=1 Tax=Streptomyces sp. NPDC086082 TaxID=3365750 RepID=UPI00381439DD
MPHSPAATTELTSGYIAQVNGDLENNAKEQERLRADIASLQEQLTALEHDHTVLANMQTALGVTQTPAAPTATPRSPAVPSLRQRAAAKPGGRQKARKTADVGPTAAKKPTAKKTAANAAAGAKTSQPTLVELIRRHLSAQSEPRSAAEIATALGQSHPERGIKTKVVRVTLEGLVAKSHAQRAKQGASVFYTAPDAPQPTAASHTDGQSDDAGH